MYSNPWMGLPVPGKVLSVFQAPQVAFLKVRWRGAPVTLPSLWWGHCCGERSDNLPVYLAGKWTGRGGRIQTVWSQPLLWTTLVLLLRKWNHQQRMEEHRSRRQNMGYNPPCGPKSPSTPWEPQFFLPLTEFDSSGVSTSSTTILYFLAMVPSVMEAMSCHWWTILKM